MSDEYRGPPLCGDVVQIREWGSETGTTLDGNELLVGSAPECGLRLRDGTASQLHARIVRDGARWWIHDLGSATGTWIDGVRQNTSLLSPGSEIRVGRTTLLAESGPALAARRLLARALGFGAAYRDDVERALAGLYDVAAKRAALVVCGGGDVFSFTHRLHRVLAGDASPFLILDRDARAFSAAAEVEDATVCMSARRFGADRMGLIESTRAARSHVRVVICASTLKSAAVCLELDKLATVKITPIELRRQELARIITEGVSEAAQELGVEHGISHGDFAWLRTRTYRAFVDIEETVRRLVAIRTLGVTRAAERLGLTHGAMSRWARRRSLS